VFSRRVVDDDTPPALQPFLQRVARFAVSVAGDGGYDTLFQGDEGTYRRAFRQHARLGDVGRHRRPIQR
jgi:hypothetical protein